MREESKFKATDFIPIVGLFSYINRNKGGAHYLKSDLSPEYKWGDFFKYEAKDRFLYVYNFALGTSLIIGLEKLLQ